MTTERTIEQLANEIIEGLNKSYDLVYVDQRDEASDAQAAAIVRGDTERFFELTDDWEMENRYEACKYIIDELSKSVIAGWEREDDGDYAGVLGDFGGSEEFDRVRFGIEERDSGGWVRQLLRNTPNVLLRISVIDEDHGYSFEEVAPERVLKDVGLPATDSNVKTMSYVLANCSPEYSVLMGYWIVGADLGDLYDLPIESDAEVEIVNPYLYLGNPFTGSGFISEQPLEGVVRVKRGELRTDKDAFGYAVDEIYGGLSASSFECEIRPLKEATL